MQRHNTDEVFVLLKGSCTPYIGDGGDEGPGTVRAVELEPGVIYNVRGAWHTHANGLMPPYLAVEKRMSPENSDHSPVNVGWFFRREVRNDPGGVEGSSLIWWTRMEHNLKTCILPFWTRYMTDQAWRVLWPGRRQPAAGSQ
ncbi:MAG: hypothetical protein ACLSB9_20705 [Hydrogeniiclostridium mannosilyticum]